MTAMTDVVAAEKTEKVLKSVVCTLVMCLGSFLTGAAAAYPSPAIPDLDGHTNPFHVDEEQTSWIASVHCIGALVGSLVAGPFMDKIGRKLTLMTFTCPFSLACVMVSASPNPLCMVVGLGIIGISIGVYSLVCPVYVVEIAPASIRGLLGSCTQMAMFLGCLYVYVLGSFMNWTWLAISVSVVNLVLVVALIFVPETPRWLLSVGRRDDAEFALKWLRGERADVKQELDTVQASLTTTLEKATLKEFLQPQLLKPLLVSVGLMAFQQFSGFNVILVYTVQIFQMSQTSLDANMQTIVVGAVGVVGTLVSVSVSDLVGRKALLLVSGLVMTLTLGGMGAFFYVLEMNGKFATNALFWLPLACLMAFIFGYSVAFGPIPWLITSELFPLRAKGVASAISVAFHFLFAFVITKFFVVATNLIMPYGVYWVCACVCVLSLPFIIFCVPETKGKTLEEIQKHFN